MRGSKTSAVPCQGRDGETGLTLISPSAAVELSLPSPRHSQAASSKNLQPKSATRNISVPLSAQTWQGFFRWFLRMWKSVHHYISDKHLSISKTYWRYYLYTASKYLLQIFIYLFNRWEEYTIYTFLEISWTVVKKPLHLLSNSDQHQALPSTRSLVSYLFSTATQLKLTLSINGGKTRNTGITNHSDSLWLRQFIISLTAC